MNSLVLKRIASQTKPLTVPKPRVSHVYSPKPKLSQPIDPEVLRKMFMSEMQATVETKLQEEHITNDIHFGGVESFANWYETEREEFSAPQQQALDTLIQARNMINAGCACQRNTRLQQAEDYYQNFWTQNKATDLPVVLSKALGTSYKISSRGEIIVDFVFGLH